DGAGARVPRDDDPDQVRAAARAQPGAVADRAGLRVRDRQRVPGGGRLQRAGPGPLRGQRHLPLRHPGRRGRHAAGGAGVRARQPGGRPAAGGRRSEGEGPVSTPAEAAPLRRTLPRVTDRFALAGAVWIALIALAALLAPWIAPYPPDEVNPFDSLRAPDGAHWFGTDAAGRDVFSRVLYGGRTSLFIAVTVLAVSATAGVLLGVVAGYAGGWVRDVIMRVTDVFLAFPALLLSVALAVVLRPSVTTVIVAIAVTWWPWYARLSASMAASIATRPYVDAARCLGVPAHMIILRHVLPNSLTPVLVQVSLDAGGVILTAAALS